MKTIHTSSAVAHEYISFLPCSIAALHPRKFCRKLTNFHSSESLFLNFTWSLSFDILNFFESWFRILVGRDLHLHTTLQIILSTTVCLLHFQTQDVQIALVLQVFLALIFLSSENIIHIAVLSDFVSQTPPTTRLN